MSKRDYWVNYRCAGLLQFEEVLGVGRSKYVFKFLEYWSEGVLKKCTNSTATENQYSNIPLLQYSNEEKVKNNILKDEKKGQGDFYKNPLANLDSCCWWLKAPGLSSRSKEKIRKDEGEGAKHQSHFSFCN